MEKKRIWKKRLKMQIVGGVNIIALLAIIMLILTPQGENLGLNAKAAFIPDEEFTPGPEEMSETEALDIANTYIQNSQFGELVPIENTDEGYFAKAIIDYRRGECRYWRLHDDEGEARVDIYSGEIIFYRYIGWTDGAKTESEILTLAENIANEFHPLPPDREDADIWFEIMLEGTELNPDTMEEVSHVTEDFWYVYYNRTKNGITAEDYIKLRIDPSGILRTYDKVWNMELDGFSTTYTVTQAEAINIAMEYIPPNSNSSSSVAEATVYYAGKKIIRPGYEWPIPGHEHSEYGNPRVICWEIWLELSGGNTRIFYVNGVTCQICGGSSSKGAVY